MSDSENNKKALAAISKIVKKYLIYFRNKQIESIKVADDDKELAEDEANLLINQMMKEVWDLNKEKVIEDLKKKNEEDLKHQIEKLKKQYEEKEQINNLKSLKSLLIQGIFIAFFIGICVNECTEIISNIKKVIYEGSGIEVWIITCVIMVLIIIIILCMILMQFINTFKEMRKFYKD